MDIASRLKIALEWIKQNQNNVLMGLFFTIGIFIGWGIGILNSGNKAPQITIDKNVQIGIPLESNRDVNVGFTGGNFVASINGVAFYPKNCKAADRIKEENKIWFNTAEEASAQGYKPAANCP
jgi:hypothetical protein